MKTIHLALIAAGFTLSASAFAFDGSIVKVPASNDHFFVGLEGLYLQASDTNGDLDYSNTNTVTAGPTTFHNNINSIDPSHQWAWRIIAGYEYGAANDITLSYLHARPSDDDSVSVTSPAAIKNPNDPFTGVIDYTSASGDVDYELDQVDLTLGQKINPLRCITLHPFGGLRYARITRDLDTTFNLPSSSFVETASDNSKFTGIGPIAGLDASFDVGNGFKIVGRVDAAVLIGTIDESFSASAVTRGTVVDLAKNVDVDSTRRVVPVIDARLGAAYTYDMGNESDFTVELGWQASAYHDAVDKVSIGNDGGLQANLAGGGTFDTPVRNTSSLGLNGPYLNFVYRM